MGVKDGRWVKYDTKYNLIDKAIWNRGFPADSRITYYDSAHTQVKEVMPVAFGEVEGEYLQFYKEGQLAVDGKYDSGKKVGRWVEYYQFRRQRKKRSNIRKLPGTTSLSPSCCGNGTRKANFCTTTLKTPERPLKRRRPKIRFPYG